MAIRDLIPRSKRNFPARRQETEDPFYSLQQEMNRIFDRFSRGWGLDEPAAGFPEVSGAYVPRVDVSENEKEVRVEAELPGLDEKNVEVMITDGSLVLKGQKEAEREERDKNYYRMERSYGFFQRAIPLPQSVDKNKAQAVFQKGVLVVTIPKSAESRQDVKKIPVKS
jgi:HSP20 family protein